MELPDRKNVITLLHGAGGTYMHSLIRDVFLKLNDGFGEVGLEMMDDAAVVNGIVFTTDSFVIRPIFFRGGDIGRLSVSGTVNDIAMMGGDPQALSLGVVLEEGFPKDMLEKIVESIKKTAEEANVHVVTGDTKVMERGNLDKIVINTAGIGTRPRQLDHNIETLRKSRQPSRWLVPTNLRDGDKIVVTGTLGDHAIAVLSSREGVGFESNVMSDVAPLNKMIMNLLEVGGIADAKDPTRGGLADLLQDWSEKSGLGIFIRESDIPVKDEVRAAVEFLGMDVLELGNEGKAVLAVSPEYVKDVMDALHSDPLGKDATIIGEVRKDLEGVIMETVVGGNRYVGRPLGDPVPRIC
ncbi:hydrogenase expression/formation protein HypE [Metallosphaera sedula]|uniref:Hydrogenase expression/formation protein HypE n=4 Tax=Metallosphaera TaxID=41980 RepID=A4YFA3_METS5|nr:MULTISPECIES: hydrogenase expression/formation protein HypE [Metallosphaera]ABP95105.1 hydrogenase expression/formation protein HypE [Metallosphaera sedula DSM 5348]AIM27091.1 hydrogenase expression/formation protein HypE [Metallosphaera sedula]AKV74003.1 hydrogenase expression protein [Metallosphaera sedula]AKV76241.1 hydrogenase expression protein [Metallosphaera sedula]AKV78495.1 hydrogenase expression protein [Metallosphaera sedula]